MRYLALGATLVVFVFTGSGANASDANGYTAQHECRVGGQRCSVDVTALALQSCQQTITTGTPWSSINWSNNVICIEPGDHTSKRPLTIPTSGTSANRKVLRYTRSNDSDDSPWKQSSGNLATVSGITVNGNYWVIHRLRAIGPVLLKSPSSDLIVNRMLVENGDGDMIEISGNRITMQNSVVRNTLIGGTNDKHCLVTGDGGADVRIVNNEIYNCQGDGLQIWQSGQDSPGMIMENNDIYLTTARYSNGSGQLSTSGSYACGENGIDMKQGGTASNPVRILHNRIWGHRMTDGSCGNGSFGEEVIFHQAASTSNSYGMIQNNIIMDGTQAIASPNYSPSHWSIVGNLMFSFSGVPTGQTSAVDLKNGTRQEVYLNTLVDVAKGMSAGWIDLGDGGNNDVSCNVVINGGTVSGSSGSTTIVNPNAFYNTDVYTANASPANVSKALTLRKNSTAMSAGDVLITSPSSNCSATTDSACFMYLVTSGGATAASSPLYCTTPGCTTTDGAVTVRAIRGPYSFYRKLQTAPELSVIPYARIHSSAPEARTCPSSYALRTGIGIDDSL